MGITFIQKKKRRKKKLYEMKEDKYEEDHWSGSSISAFSSIKESFDGSSAMYHRILCISGKANLMTSQKHKDYIENYCVFRKAINTYIRAY